jgi:hypothetical protein
VVGSAGRATKLKKAQKKKKVLMFEMVFFTVLAANLNPWVMMLLA